MDFSGWCWWVDIFITAGLVQFNVSRHFSYPRDAKFCDEYASKGLVLITPIGGEGLAVVETLSWFTL